MKVSITLEDVKRLHDLSKQNDTLEAWAELALEWMESAQTHINNLTEGRKNERDQKV